MTVRAELLTFFVGESSWLAGVARARLGRRLVLPNSANGAHTLGLHGLERSHLAVDAGGSRLVSLYPPYRAGVAFFHSCVTTEPADPAFEALRLTFFVLVRSSLAGCAQKALSGVGEIALVTLLALCCSAVGAKTPLLAVFALAGANETSERTSRTNRAHGLVGEV